MIHHFLFANDILFVCKENAEQSKEVMSILKEYGLETRKIINQVKSAITFGSRVHEEIKNQICILTGMSNE